MDAQLPQGLEQAGHRLFDPAKHIRFGAAFGKWALGIGFLDEKIRIVAYLHLVELQDVLIGALARAFLKEPINVDFLRNAADSA